MANTITFDYKKEARRVYYDIESLPSLFTCTFFDGKVATLWFFGSHVYDDVTDDEISNAFASYMKDEYHRIALGLKNDDKCNIVLNRFYVGNKNDTGRLRIEIAKMLSCQALSTDVNKGFTEYASWNGFNYDLPMMVLIKHVMGNVYDGHEFEPYDIRRLSDTMVQYDGNFRQIGAYLHDKFGLNDGMYVEPSSFKLEMNTALWYDGHIDIAKILKTTNEDGEEAKFPPGLKLQKARRGGDIMADDEVAHSEKDRVLSKEGLFDFLKYNLDDVAYTRWEGETKDATDRLNVRDIVREMYPYTSARATKNSDLQYKQPLERDCTEASLSARALRGENLVKMVDYDGVDYTFPVPDGNGGFKNVDYLDYIMETEEYVPNDFYRFFDFWRGVDNRTWEGLKAAKRRAVKLKVCSVRKSTSGEGKGGATLNIPYYRKSDDGKYIPIDSYIRVSTGGAHGSLFSGLHKLDEKQAHEWSMVDKDLKGKEKNEHIPTLDLLNVVHADATSFYPYLCKKKQVFIGADGIDRYSLMYDRRVEIKEQLSKYPDTTLWTPEQISMNNSQKGLKMQLNAPTGKANSHSEYAMLPLDNKILSMRLIGNMTIWLIAQRMVYAGGYIVSTNTDGIYVANISMERAQEVLDDITRLYGIPVEPELMERFINRDVSNRFELMPDHSPDGHKWKVNKIGGTFRSANKLVFNDTEHGHSVTYPLAVGNAVVRYMVEDEDWLKKPYDKQRMVNIYNDIKENSTAIAWCQIYNGTRARHLLIDGKSEQKVSRVVLTTDGCEILETAVRTIDLTSAFNIWNMCCKSKKGTRLKDIESLYDIHFSDECRNVLCSDVKFVFYKAPESKRYDAIFKMPKQPTGVFESKKEFDAWRKADSIFVNAMAYRDTNGNFQLIKVWKEKVVSGYPTGAKGRVLNLAKELNDFDLNTLDDAAYMEWIESELSRWKVGANLTKNGELEMITFNDDLVDTTIKLTKAEQSYKIISDMYDKSLGKLFTEEVR